MQKRVVRSSLHISWKDSSTGSGRLIVYKFVFDCALMHAVGLGRDAVAECSEVAYKKLSLSEAKRLLDFNSDQEVLDYIGDAEKSWTVKDGTVFFQDIEKPIGSQDIPSMRLITESLQYCVELERIV